MKLSVAMCTYNGASFLQQQLDSIAKQTRLPDELVVCDDGSSDATVDVLNKFAVCAPFPVRLHSNQSNLGVKANFSKAIGLCDGSLVALADQDDVWLPHKLARAEQLILQQSNPAITLYCSRLEYVNQSLAPLGLSRIPSYIGFKNSIVENIATGCSVMFGRDIRNWILQTSPSDMIMHDWWAYLIASALGDVVYDPVPSVLYRQHEKNVAGWRPRPEKIANRLCLLAKRLRGDQVGMDSLNQAARFASAFPSIRPEHRLMVEELLDLRKANVLKRIHYALHPNVSRNDGIEDFGLRLMLLMGWH